jgi:aspartyl-tRNA(Asn)/glutamyl-tRNA(Gln) amidotransferase subunit A
MSGTFERLGAVVARADVRGSDHGPLAGRTLAVKDNLDVAGLPTLAGGQPPSAESAAAHAPVVERLLAAGAHVTAKTAMVQLAFGGWGTNALTGTPWNPWDAREHRVPGGSSSGSAVVLAAGLAELALGTDTGGSVRIPAALCGVSALKPRRGLVPDTGLVPLAPSLDVIGPMARRATDLRPMFEAMASTSTPPALPKLRVAAPPAAGLVGCDPDVLEAFAAALGALAGLGAQVSEVVPPAPFDSYVPVLGAVLGREAWQAHGWRLETEPFDPHVAARLRAGAAVTAADYESALASRAGERARWLDALSGFDLLATPTVPIAAVPLAQVDQATLPLSRFTRLANWLDLAAVSVPCGFTLDGLPIGLQLIGLPGEAAPLALAEAYETATAWHERRPPLWCG